MMKHAGFAVLAQVRGRVLDDIVRIYYNAGALPSTISGTRTVTALDATFAVSFDFFVNAPRVTLVQSATNRIGLTIPLEGTLTVDHPSPGLRFSGRVTIRVFLAANPRITVLAELGMTQLVIDGSALEINRINLTGASSTHEAALNSDEAKAAILDAIRAQLGDDVVSIPLLVSIPPDIRISRIGHKVLDGSLAAFIDVDAPGFGVQTTGVDADIADLIGQSDIGICINPTLLPIFEFLALPLVRSTASASGIEVDSLRFGFTTTALTVAGHVHQGDFGANFDLKIRPHLGKPEQYLSYDEQYGERLTEYRPGHERIWFEVFDVNLHEQLPWYAWLGIVGGSILFPILTPGIAGIVSSLIQGVKLAATYQLTMQGEDFNVSGTPVSRIQAITLPETMGPWIKAVITTLAFGTDGIRARSTVKPYIGRAGRIDGPDTIANIASLSAPVRYHLNPSPMLAAPFDPYVRVRWQVRRRDTNQVVRVIERPGTDPAAYDFDLDLRDADLRPVPNFTISARVYRATIASSPDLVNTTAVLRILDRLDRRRPYVRWRHSVYTPQMEPGFGGLELVGYNDIARTSAIHRTAIPGRCHFADRYSSKIDAANRIEGGPTLEYLDELPFPLTDLLRRRAELCDYCFFGGPDKTTPLPLP